MFKYWTWCTFCTRCSQFLLYHHALESSQVKWVDFPWDLHACMTHKFLIPGTIRACADVKVNHLLIVCLSARFTSYDPFWLTIYKLPKIPCTCVSEYSRVECLYGQSSNPEKCSLMHFAYFYLSFDDDDKQRFS